MGPGILLGDFPALQKFASLRPFLVPMLVLVRDPRFEIGGFETWVETLSRGLPNLGISVTVLVPGGSGSASTWSTRLQPANVITVDIAEDVCKQARFILVALQTL